MWKTDALNQMFPQYAVDPSVGGRMYYTRGKKINPTDQMGLDEYATHLRDLNLDEKSRALLLQDRIKKYNNTENDYADPDIISAHYGKKGGTQMAYVMGSNVFPFMFY